MDYEKKYKEALEWMRSVYPTMKGAVREDAEHYFPELKESDDTNISKDLIWCLTHCGLKPDEPINPHVNTITKDAIDWLTKQDNQKYNIDCILNWSKEDEKMFQTLDGIVKDYWTKAEQENNKVKIIEASKVCYFLKTIQKSPLCWIKCSDGLPNKDGIYLIVTDGRHNDVYDIARYDSINGWHKASEVIYWMPIPKLNNKSTLKQNPTWSEKDEAGLGDALWAIQQARTIAKDENDMGNLWYAETWLKSLKDRIK